MRYLVRNARIIDPLNKIDKVGNLSVADGKILAVGQTPDDFSADREINAEGKLLIPGLVDLCARFREPGFEHKATIASEAEAASQSGVTTICHPPDTDPILDTAAVAELIQQRAEAASMQTIHPLGAMTVSLRGEQLSEMLALKAAGCIGVSNGYAEITDADIFRHALEYAGSCSMKVVLQSEDSFLARNGVAHEGPIATRLGLSPIPETAETISVSRTLLLMEKAACSVHFGRISCASSVEMIREAKGKGLPVSADVSICNLHLSDMDVDGYNVDCHLRPPLRSERDKDALCRALADGTIDAICSDHQPHNEDAKAAPFAESESGASTIELLLPLVLKLVDKEKFSLSDAIACVTSRAAKVFQLDSGSLGVGKSADMVIVDPESFLQVDRGSMVSAGKNTPFHGWELHNLASHTFFQGRLVYERNVSPNSSAT